MVQRAAGVAGCQSPNTSVRTLSLSIKLKASLDVARLEEGHEEEFNPDSEQPLWGLMTSSVFLVALQVLDNDLAAKSVMGGFFTASQDKTIHRLDIDGEELFTFVGHEGAVNSLAEHGDILYSGSWDGTARAWDANSAEFKYSVEVSSHAVTVGVLPTGQLVTGSTDKQIKIWNGENLVKAVDAHEDIIRAFAVSSNFFASTSNDMLVKLWSLDGEAMSTLAGHTAFIFGLDVNSDGSKVYSCGDDHTLKVWDVNSTSIAQSILHAKTLWDVACLPNGDVATAGADGIVRLWTQDPGRMADEDLRLQQKNDAEMSTAEMAAKGASAVPMDKVTDIALMPTTKGKQGEVKMFKDKDKVMAYSYNGSTWDCVGEVTGAEAKTAYAGDQYFPAGEYDFVFDVQLGDDDIPENRAKLPFNKSDNPMTAAERFIARQKINKGFVQQIRDFIRANAGLNGPSGPTITQKAAAPKPASNGYPAGGANGANKHFVTEKGLIIFKSGKVDMMGKKIAEFNATLDPPANEDAPETARFTGVQERTYFPGLVTNLGKLHNGTVRQCERELLFDKMRTEWPLKDGFFVVVDMMRLYLIVRDSTELFKGADKGVKYIAAGDRSVRAFLLGEGMPEDQRDGPLRLVSARFIANLSEQPTNRFACLRQMQHLCDAITEVVNTGNKNTRSALGACMINFGIQFAERGSAAVKPSEAAQDSFFKAAAALANAAATAGDEECVYACLVAAGSATTNHNTPKMKELTKQFVEKDAKAAITKCCTSGKNAEVLRDIHTLISK
eukprot:gene986-338_t